MENKALKKAVDDMIHSAKMSIGINKKEGDRFYLGHASALYFIARRLVNEGGLVGYDLDSSFEEWSAEVRKKISAGSE